MQKNAACGDDPTGVESGLNLRGEGLHGRYFRALGARVVSSAIWFVADVPKLTIGAAAGTTVEFTTDGSLLECLGRYWLDGSADEGVGLASGGGGG